MHIKRFDIPLMYRHTTPMPVGSLILPNVVRSDRLHGSTIWALVNGDLTPRYVNVTFHHLNTDHVVDFDLLTNTYIGSWSEFQGVYEHHVFTTAEVKR